MGSAGYWRMPRDSGFGWYLKRRARKFKQRMHRGTHPASLRSTSPRRMISAEETGATLSAPSEDVARGTPELKDWLDDASNISMGCSRRDA